MRVLRCEMLIIIANGRVHCIMCDLLSSLDDSLSSFSLLSKFALFGTTIMRQIVSSEELSTFERFWSL